MGLEKLTASAVDRPKESVEGVDKREAVEHLRDLRNILTPLINDYVNGVRHNGVSNKELEMLNEEEYGGELVDGPLIESLYKFIKLKVTPADIEELEDWAWLDEEWAQESSSSPMNEFEDRFRKIRSLFKNGNFDPNSINPLLEKYSLYAAANTEELYERPEQAWWKDGRINEGSAEGIIIGKPLIADEENNLFPPVIAIPVGEYGPVVALKIFDVIQLLLSKTILLKEKSVEMVNAHRELFAKTGRGESDLRLLEDMSFSAYKTMQEGIVTLGQAIAQLTSKKIPGYEDNPGGLIEEIIRNELPTKLGYLAPPAYIGPFSLSGHMIENLVVQDDDGKPILNSDVLNVFTSFKTKLVSEEIASEKNQDFLPAGGRGCPVSFKGQGIAESGIQQLSKVFLEIYKDNLANSENRVSKIVHKSF